MKNSLTKIGSRSYRKGGNGVVLVARTKDFKFKTATKKELKIINQAWKNSDLTKREFNKKVKAEINENVKVNRLLKLGIARDKVSKNFIKQTGELGLTPSNISQILKERYEAKVIGSKVGKINEKNFNKELNRLKYLQRKNINELTISQFKKLISPKFFSNFVENPNNVSASDLFKEVSRIKSIEDFYIQNKELLMEFHDTGNTNLEMERIIRLIYNNKDDFRFKQFNHKKEFTQKEIKLIEQLNRENMIKKRKIAGRKTLEELNKKYGYNKK